jgi:hypothetical protein
MSAAAAKITGQGIMLSSIGEKLALLSNVSNGDSVPATVPGLETLSTPPSQMQVSGLARGRAKTKSLNTPIPKQPCVCIVVQRNAGHR